MHAPATSSVRDLRAAEPSWAMHACTQLHAPCTAAACAILRPGGGPGGAAGVDPGAGVGVACGPRGRGRVEFESKSLKKLLFRDFYNFSPQQTFSLKNSSYLSF